MGGKGELQEEAGGARCTLVKTSQPSQEEGKAGFLTPSASTALCPSHNSGSAVYTISGMLVNKGPHPLCMLLNWPK